MMPGVPRKVRAVVERLQPYHRRKWPDTALLGQLKEIDNWDKHRALTTAAAYTEDTTVNVTITGNASVLSQTTFRGWLKTGAVLARLQLTPGTQEGDKMHMECSFAPIPIFDNGMPKQLRGIAPIATLWAAGQFIDRVVIPLFRPLLK
jgi:hypothetical protein